MTQRSSSLVRFAVERRVTMGMAVLGVIVLGVLSLQRLPLEYLPSFSSQNVSVTVPYPSSSPAEVERLIVRPLEDSLGTINGVETLSATASASQARIDITFVDGTDMDMASVDVRDRIDRVRHLLPSDLDRIRIRRFQTTDIPVLRFDASAPWPREKLYEFAETVLQRRLERLEDVAQVDLRGVRAPELQINLDPGRMSAHGVDVRRLRALLRENNVNLSGGDVRESGRKLLVRAIGEFGNPREVGALPINDTGLRLADVADVEYTYPRQDSFDYLNGIEALTVSINKASNANLLAVVDRVKAELTQIEALPEAEGLDIRVYRDSSKDVRKGLGQLRDAGTIGGLLAIVAVYLFLRRVRTTLLIALAIPVSIVATFVLIYFLRAGGAIDMTLNVVSLAGLMLALGMLVDNSVVVIESVFRHRNELGQDSEGAALHGASEVALPIVASTVTTMCVFLPLIFLGSGGRFALYMQNIGITICIVIVASLIVALTVVPMVASMLLRGQSARPTPMIDGLVNVYGRALGFTLRFRILFLIPVVGLLYWSIEALDDIERSFASRSLEREVMVYVDTPRQYSLDQTRALFEEVYEILDARRAELDIADISHEFSRAGGRSRGGFGRSRRFSIYLVDEDEGKLTTVEARERIRTLLPVRAGVELGIATSRGRHGSSGVEIELSGDDPAVLELLSAEVAAQVASLPTIRDVDTSLESGDEEIHVEVSRERTLNAGLSTQAVALTVNNALSSRAVSHIKSGEREIDVVMQIREEDRETLDQLKNVSVYADDVPLPLGALVEFHEVPGPRSIRRENHSSKVTVTANVTDARASFGAMGMVSEIMREVPLPQGYSWSFGRWNRYQQQDQRSGLFALMFALPLVYMLLAALFESFTQPFTIMFSVPFALIGVVWVLTAASQPWDNMTMIGMIVLMGVVVNNAIVLIDHINYLRKQGMDRTAAIVKGGQHRLRPILITAVTTVLGMMPLVAPILFPQWFGPVEGRAATWAPIGLVIVGGLTTSTFLTLIVIPMIYSLIDDVTAWARRVLGAA
ncbi:MAG: efflux RND transporter permease subunit [bacterium]|nr:efflux RND transporter permease subunit [bacterium]